MAIPVVTSVSPSEGPTDGGDIVRLVGIGFAAHIEVRFGGAGATILGVREESSTSIADVRTPAHDVGVVDVELGNLAADGAPVPGEVFVLSTAYRFSRPKVAREADLTRLIRRLLRSLKQQVIGNVSASVSVDYDDTPLDGMNVITMASLPSLVLSGPTLRESRFYSTNVLHEDVVAGSSGPEIVRRRSPFTVDLLFTLTGGSRRTAEVLNLLATVVTWLNRHPWLELVRDPDRPDLGTVRWEMAPDGELRTQLTGADDVRTFAMGFVVRGFDVDEGALPFDLGKAVRQPELETLPVVTVLE